MDMAGEAEIDPVLFDKRPDRPAPAPDAQERPVPNTVRRGMGLDNLQARASSRSGSIKVESAQGVGTIVTAVFPE